MSSLAISASIQTRACTSNNVIKKQIRRPASSLDVQEAHAVVKTLNVKSNGVEDIPRKIGSSNEFEKDSDIMTGPKFVDKRWKNGTWDLNMFVKNAKMDWDDVITAEATRRRFLQVYPESSTNSEPVLFRSSIIPWWAWLMRSYLPEAERLNGRAAMLGFFMAYVVDGLTGLDVVGQTGNLICKAGVFVTVVGLLIFRRSEDLENLKKLADEATLYDKQWQSSWNDPNPANTNT
ncbi:hypothetical protein ACFE04_007577 [Oxalis oulophora]